MDFIIGKEGIVVLATFSQLMAEKIKETISHVGGWVNGRIEIAAVRSYSHMIWELVVRSEERRITPGS